MFTAFFCILFLLVLLLIIPDRWQARREIAKHQEKQRGRITLL
jgi:hypothetical protein